MFFLVLAFLVTLLFVSLYRNFGKIQYSNTKQQHTVNSTAETVNVSNNDLNSEVNQKITSKALELKKIYPDFVLEIFIKQSEQTFDEVFNAFASSQHQVLKTNLSEPLYEQFANQIQKRDDNNLRQEISIVHKKTEIDDIKINSSDVEITVIFTVEQVSAMVNAEGVSYDNPSKLARNVKHTWVFSSHIIQSSLSQPQWLITRTNAKEI